MPFHHRGRTLVALSLTAVLAGCGYFRNSVSPIEEAEQALQAGDDRKAEQLYRDTMRDKRSRHSDEARALLINLLINRGGRLMSQGKP
ncbi:MAG TPA: hypothetical protein VK034_00855, partial [Enhygromyxa sp.]|nr:hypothetical protein [Enhygromyxa sp.]